MARVALRWSSFYLPFLLTALVGVPVEGFVQSFDEVLGVVVVPRKSAQPSGERRDCSYGPRFRFPSLSDFSLSGDRAVGPLLVGSLLVGFLALVLFSFAVDPLLVEIVPLALS
jgi:hypothetical protein